MNKCIECGKEYEAKTVRSRYCSHVCRANANKVAQLNTAQPELRNVDDNLTVTLSDGQRFVPDTSGRDILESWYRGEGTEYQQQLGTLSLQYDILKGSDKARERAEMIYVDGAWHQG